MSSDYKLREPCFVTSVAIGVDDIDLQAVPAGPHEWSFEDERWDHLKTADLVAEFRIDFGTEVAIDDMIAKLVRIKDRVDGFVLVDHHNGEDGLIARVFKQVGDK